MLHTCTSDCQKTKDCPLCPHGKDEETYCDECDGIAEKKELETFNQE